MQITVASPRSGRREALCVSPDERVGALQVRLARALGVEPRHVRLVHGAVVLRACQTVRELGPDATLYRYVSVPQAVGWRALPASAAPEEVHAPSREALARLVVERLCFDEAFVRDTLRDSPVLRRLAAADPRLAEALADPRLPRLLCEVANDPASREELVRQRERALADPGVAEELLRLRDVAAAPRGRAARPRYGRELRALRALAPEASTARLRRLLARCRGDVGRALALLRRAPK